MGSQLKIEGGVSRGVHTPELWEPLLPSPTGRSVSPAHTSNSTRAVPASAGEMQLNAGSQPLERNLNCT